MLDTINAHQNMDKQNAGHKVGIGIDSFKGLKQRPGKMVVEVLPSIDWNKRIVVLDKYMQGITSGTGDQKDKTGNAAIEPIVLYIGDDVTDEDRAVMKLNQDSSFGIVVNENTGTGLARETNAKYILPQQFKLNILILRLLIYILLVVYGFNAILAPKELQL